MIVVFPALGFLLVIATTLLVGLLGAAAARRWGGLLALLFAMAPVVLGWYAGNEIGPAQTKLDDADDIRRAFNQVVFVGLCGVTLVSALTTAFLLYRSVRSSSKTGVFLAGDFARALLRFLVITCWTAAGLLAVALFAVLVIKLAGLDPAAERVKGVVGIATLGGGIAGFLLSVWRRLPGTRER